MFSLQKRLYLTARNAGNRNGKQNVAESLNGTMLISVFVLGDLQNGWISYEDARRRKHTRKAHRQNIPTNGQEQGWKVEFGGIHRRRQE